MIFIIVVVISIIIDHNMITTNATDIINIDITCTPTYISRGRIRDKTVFENAFGPSFSFLCVDCLFSYCLSFIVL